MLKNAVSALLGVVTLCLVGIGVSAQAQSPDQTPFLCSSDALPPGVYALCATPNPLVTDTPTVTRTPTATVTPTSTATTTPLPDNTATPTQENTPLPTFTATPIDNKFCSLKANRNINIRPAHDLNNQPIGLWGVGENKRLVSFYEDRALNFLWAEHQSGGWSVIAVINPFAWWVDSTPESALCFDLPGWPAWTLPPDIAGTLQGGHTIAANGANTLLTVCRNTNTVMLFQDMIGYADDFHACNPDMWIVCRFWTDSIAHDTHYNADESYARIGEAFPRDCDGVIWENESTPTNPQDWAKWSGYSIRAAQLMGQRGMQYCAFGLGPGWPAFDDLVYLLPYLEWVNENPLPDGRYHCIAAHASMIAPWSRADMPWVNNAFITPERWHKFRDWYYVLTHGEFDLDEWKGVIAITEIGLSDGYSGNWGAPYSCEELASATWETVNTLTAWGYPGAIMIWNFGKAGIWTDDSRCAAIIWPRPLIIYVYNRAWG